jgi:putative PIN family toxin of toxin-antitoxin system
VLRVVCDTVVFVRALINPKSRAGRLLFDFAGSYILIISKPTAKELLEVIQRPELTRKNNSLAKVHTRRVIDLLSRAEAVEIGAAAPVVRGPKDDIFVATALEALVDYLVSEDKDLIVLGTRLGVPIISTQTFLEILEREN